ncbi:hypothetical protein AKJ16_DCAP11937 [Drosera capensis]
MNADNQKFGVVGKSMPSVVFTIDRHIPVGCSTHDPVAAAVAPAISFVNLDAVYDIRDKILGKAFGQIHSPYWSEEREAVVPRQEAVCSILEYLRSLSLTDDDLAKLLKKFPEFLGCSLEDEVKNNVRILEKDWGIEWNSLNNLLLRNPKVYSVDCKGDCMAQCSRRWVWF